MDENPPQEQVEATAATVKTTHVRPIFFITQRPFVAAGSFNMTRWPPVY
jgi:hypothetical protein